MDRILRLATLPRLAGLVVIAMLLDGCSGSGTQVTANSPSSSSPTGTTPTPSPTPPATALGIAGTPAASVTAGSAYSFQPTVSASTGTVTFSITGQPAWASFSMTTGSLTGTPPAGAVGTTGSIAITASDGSSRAYLAPFTIQVKAAVASSPPPTTGTATLSWTQPTHNIDGSPITGLAGYHIYYGPNQSNPSQRIDLSGATATTYVVQGLAPGTYYFTVVAYNDAGIDSPDSNVAVKTI
jgi:putative Ig domain-containing protein